MIEDPERLTAALEAWMSVTLGGDCRVESLRRATSGQSSGTFLFDLAGHSAEEDRSFVLRTQPGPGHLFPDPDVIREAAVINGLAELGQVPVPRILGVESNPAVLGCPFFVMDHVSGRVPQGKPSIHVTGWLPELGPLRVRSMWESALATMVAVHATPWRRSHPFLGPDGTSEDFLARRVAWIERYYRWVVGSRSYPITDHALRYLLEHRHQVVPSGPALVWGDARVGNMIIAPDLSVAAAIDWEVATVGPPEIDLAHWLFFDQFSTEASGFARLDGWPDRDETVRLYQEMSGHPVVDLEYYDVMQALFMATTLIRQSDNRVERGLAGADTRMGHDNTVTQMLARMLELPVPELSADYAAHRAGPIRAPAPEA